MAAQTPGASVVTSASDRTRNEGRTPNLFSGTQMRIRTFTAQVDATTRVTTKSNVQDRVQQRVVEHVTEAPISVPPIVEQLVDVPKTVFRDRVFAVHQESSFRCPRVSNVEQLVG